MQQISPSPQAAIEFVRFLTQPRSSTAQAQPRDVFDNVLRGITSLQAFKGKVTCSIKVTPDVANRFGGLHGGCIATIVDTIGTAAMVTVQERSGVSTHISVDYLSPSPLGTWVDIEAEVVKAGRSVSLVRVTLTNRDTGKVVAVGTHQKFVGRADDQLAAEMGPPRSKL